MIFFSFKFSVLAKRTLRHHLSKNRLHDKRLHEVPGHLQHGSTRNPLPIQHVHYRYNLKKPSMVTLL